MSCGVSARAVSDRPRLPEWLRHALPTSRSYGRTRSLLEDLRLHTVCESARCPNHWECWGRGTATFMIAGDRCTRACGFCAVSTLKPLPPDPGEPERVAEAVQRMRLRHVVITAVARDDLTDGGAGHFRATIEAVRAVDGEVRVEVLTPDFGGREEDLAVVLEARPDVFNHNLETVRRLTPSVRHRATYERSLELLRRARRMGSKSTHVKSGLMVGLGEEEREVTASMDDLREAGCELLTLGQYLQPTVRHLPVIEYVRPEQFERYGRIARAKGFRHVASGPKVRSSYHADDFDPIAEPGRVVAQL